MSFATWEFLIFFCTVVPITFIIPRKFKIVYILGASYLFYYLGNSGYTWFLIVSTLVDFFLAKAIAQTSNDRHRKVYLGLSLCFNVGFLILLRSFAFTGEAVAIFISKHLSSLNLETLVLSLPLGLSFYTFTKIAYVVDVYQRRIKPEKKMVTFAATIAYFPNVTAGPIEKVEHLLPQFKHVGRFNEKQVTDGLRLILWGTFKKVVIANQLEPIVNVVYEQPQDFHGAALIIATLLFAFQIYADFSGYSDIAIGIARILGVNLFENFRQPYLSRSILEFWRRWHMSLTNWVRAYLFFPLSRKLLKKTNRRHGRLIEISAYLTVMSLVGLWHGTSLTFLFWGLLHGIYMIGETALPPRFRRGRSTSTFAYFANVALTFGLVVFAWIFFRAENLADAFYIITHLFSFTGNVSEVMILLESAEVNMALNISLVLLIISSDWFTETGNANRLNGKGMTVFRWGLYYAALFAIWVVHSGTSSSGDFIYFQF